MTMIGVYAVVSKESNEVVASFVTHPGQSLPKNINSLTLDYSANMEISFALLMVKVLVMNQILFF